MQGWKLFKALMREVGLYRKKLIFFGVILLVGLSIYYLWQNSKNAEASLELSTPEEGYSSQVTMDVEVTQNAQVIINGEKKNKALKFYNNYDELKIMVFNSPGYFIGNFEGTVHLPSSTSPNDIRPIIYAVHGVGSNDYYMLDSQTIVYRASEISPQAVLTIVADFPKGMVKPTIRQKINFALEQFPLKAWFYVAIILPSITVLVMIFMIIKRRSAQFFLVKTLIDKPPTKDYPAVVGVLVDGTVGAREISATLIDLARRGYIFIVNKDNSEFSFGRRKSGNFETMPDLSPFEKVLLAKIFLAPSYKSTLADVETRIGRHIFSRKIAQFYLGVYNHATKNGYFVKNPAKIHLIYKYTGIMLFFVSFLGFAIGALSGADPKFGLIFWVGGMVAASSIIKFSALMPARSALGRKLLGQWLGFRRYLSSKKSLEAKDVLQGKFEEFLPYAIVLGAEVEWAKRFGKEPFTKPEWYESAERAVTLESFTGQFFPFIGYVAENLARSHEPTVE